MSQPLRWDLYGNDQLSQTLDKLARSVDALGRKMDATSRDARQMGDGLAGAGAGAGRMGQAMNDAGRHAGTMGSRLLTADRVAAGMRGTLSRADGLFRAAGAAATSFGLSVVAAGTLAAGGLVGFGVHAAAANETAQISFEVLLKSGQKARVFLGELQEFAARTPFELPELRTSASRLLAVGLEAKRVIPLMTVLGDATAAMGTGSEGINRSVTALSQMRQKTKVTAEEMLQLTEAGIPAWEALAAQLRTDVAGAMDQVAARTVDADVVFRALETRAGAGLKNLSGMMDRQSQSLAGMWSSFKDNAGQALATFMQPAMPAIKAGLGWLATNVPKGFKLVTDGAREIGSIFAGSDIPQRIKDSWRETADEIMPKLASAWDDFTAFVKDNKEELETFGRFVADVIIPFLGELIVFTARVAVGWGAIAVKLTTLVVPAFRFTSEAMLTFVGIMIDAAVKAFGWVPELGDKLRTAQADFAIFTGNVHTMLDGLEGRNVGVDISLGRQSFGSAPKRRALGGPFDPFDVLDVGEHGPERIVMGASPGVVIPREALGGGGGSGEGQAPLTIVLEGQAVWQGLLRFKTRSGKTVLGLA